VNRRGTWRGIAVPRAARYNIAMPIPLLVIVGPTGSGKTETAVLAARALGGEILTADSMQVYCGMDIGTAKPTAAEQQGIPHHLIDLIAPDEEFSVAAYVALADRLIDEIRARGKVPILTGGTGFYISALIDRWTFPPQAADTALREALRQEADQAGGAVLLARLREIDPITAARLHVHDVKRIIRALEVHQLTGQPLSAFQHKPAGDAPGRYAPMLYGLTIPRETLYARLALRVQQQLDAGLLEEIRGLYAAGYGPELSAMKGITYRQLVGYLRDEYNFDTAVELMVRDNRRYAKRQYTWFNADPRIRWLDLSVCGGTEGAAREIVASAFP